MNLTFSSKSANLKSLEGSLKNAVVLPQICFSILMWKQKPNEILNTVIEQGFDKKVVILRSSAKNEDVENNSLAGHYDSISNILGVGNIKKAIDKLATGNKLNIYDELFIQPQIERPSLFGVAFSRNPNNNSPYIVINYDTNGSTSNLTSGKSTQHQTIYIHRQYNSINNIDLENVVKLLFELENIFSTKSLDIEFAIDKESIIYLFQVRSLNTNANGSLSDHDHYKSVCRIAEKISSYSKENPFNFGEKNVYGNMPDWNPAEIIGVRPRQLALSIYREVVTDSIWAYQRDNYGYRNQRSNPLIIEFEGMPYIDTRVSFNSFIPKSLDPKISEKLVNFYTNKLIKNNSLHDKIEFDIAYTCYDFSLREKLSCLKGEGFSEKEIDKIKFSLKTLTNNIICPQSGLWQIDKQKIQILESRHQRLLASDLDKISKLYWLIEDCKRYGTLPFAGLARAGFIAASFLKSFVTADIFSSADYYSFLNSLDTISSNISHDFVKLSKIQFLEKYGHLRPGTYDIRSKRYDEAPDLYFNWNAKNIPPNYVKGQFSISGNQLKAIDKLLKDHEISLNSTELLEFIREAIKAREHSKFVFSKSLSSFLKLFSEYALEYDINLDDASYVNIRDILSLYSSSSSPAAILKNSILIGKAKNKNAEMICLPSLIWESNQAFCFEENESNPNFITNNSVTARIELLSNIDEVYKHIGGKVVAIVSADPGYDWIFSHNISGLITKYGGANSHMAIRAAELGIPAVIGTGTMFDKLSTNQTVNLNCSEKILRIISN